MKPASAFRRHAFPSLARLRAQAGGDPLADLLDELPGAAPDPALLDDARREGHALGHAEGYAAGLEAGGARAKALVDEGLKALSQPLQALLDGFAQLQDQHRQALRHELAPLVEQVAQQVVRAELMLAPERLLQFVEEALASLPVQPDTVEVRLNPEEYQRIRAAAPEQAARWQLSPDERLPAGECRIRAGARELDAGCGQRLAACMEQLRGLLGRADDDTPAAA